MGLQVPAPWAYFHLRWIIRPGLQREESCIYWCCCEDEGNNFAHPKEKTSAIEKYCTTFYGSNLWRLDSTGVDQLESSWRTSAKLSYDLPRHCHRYVIDNLLAPNIWPIKSSLLSRFHGFSGSLILSESPEVQLVTRLAARDVRSSLGSNLRLIHDMTDLNPWTTSRLVMKEGLREVTIAQTPEEDYWRVGAIQSIMITS